MKDPAVHDDQHDDWTQGDEAFVTEASRHFRSRVDALDANTRSRLNRARQAALAELAGSVRRPEIAWRSVAAMAAVGLVAVTLWFGGPLDRSNPNPTGHTQAPLVAGEASGQAPDEIADLDLMLAAENFDMFEDIDFFAWLDASLTEEELEAELEAVG